MTIAIAKIDIALMAVGGGEPLRRLVTANAPASNGISIAYVPRSSRSRAAIGRQARDGLEQQNIAAGRTAA